MKNVSITRLEFFSYLILAFSLGFCFNWSLKIFGVIETPNGNMVFHNVINDDRLTMQVAFEHITNERIVMWVRERRAGPFVSESGLIANMTLSKVILSCPNKSISINEQRIFDSSMQHIATFNTVPVDESIIAFIIYSGICQPVDPSTSTA